MSVPYLAYLFQQIAFLRQANIESSEVCGISVPII